jgi:L-galactono-1,4-lactone dehydrogenase
MLSLAGTRTSSWCTLGRQFTMQEVKWKHAKWLRDNRHLRYMWIPHTDAVVVVSNNPLPKGNKAPKNPANYSEAEKTVAFQQLLQVC